MKDRLRLVALALVAAYALSVAAADDLSIDVDRSGRGFTVRAAATLAAPRAMVWEVLTDYDNLTRFIPDLSHSAVRLRVANRVLLEQRGEARFFVFAYPIEVRLEVLESPAQWISSRRVAGNLRRLSGRYELERAGEGILLRYTGELEPDFTLPPLIGTLAVRGMVEKQFAAMVTEIERRAALNQ